MPRPIAHPEQAGQNRLGDVRGRASAPRSPCRQASTASMPLPASVSKTCLVRFDNNKYSVNASAVGRHRRDPRLCRSCPHPAGWSHRRRSSPRLQAAARRSAIPGITFRFSLASQARLRNGAPFKDWVLPAGPGTHPAQARPARTTGIARWRRSSPLVLTDGLVVGRCRLRRGARSKGSRRPT